MRLVDGFRRLRGLEEVYTPRSVYIPIQVVPRRLRKTGEGTRSRLITRLTIGTRVTDTLSPSTMTFRVLPAMRAQATLELPRALKAFASRTALEPSTHRYVLRQLPRRRPAHQQLALLPRGPPCRCPRHTDSSRPAGISPVH